MVSTARSSITRCKLSISDSAATIRSLKATSRRVRASTDFDDLPLGKAAHLGDEPIEFLQITVKCLGGMFDSHCVFLATKMRQPNRPVM